VAAASRTAAAHSTTAAAAASTTDSRDDTSVIAAPPDVHRFGPISLVIIQPTSFCNLNCGYCYLPDRDKRNELSLDLIEPIFRRIFESPFVGDAFTVCWHAGEPLAVPIAFYEEAFARIDAASRRYNAQGAQITQSLQTNAVPINQAWCDLFLRHDVQVGVSIDGPDFIHDAHRTTRSGGGSHAAAMRGVRLLQQNGVPLNVIAVISERSLDFPDEIYAFFMDNGLTDVGFNMEETEGINTRSTLDAAAADERYRAFMQRIYALTEAGGGAFKLREFEALANMIYFDQRLVRTDMNAPFAILNVDYQGNFSTFDPELLGVTTERYGRFVLGNVREDTLESACTSDAFLHMHADMRAGVDRCRAECAYFGVCGGGTGSNKYWENGTFDSTETNACRYRIKAVTDILVDALEQKALG
jgi:uncharacterized protein